MEEAGPVVLVIDDVVEIVEELVALLAMQKIAAIGAHNLREALAMLEQAPGVRIVACDVRLGRESGLEIIERVERNPRLRDRDLRYVFVTGDTMNRDVLAAIPSSSILTKPIQPRALVGLFRELLADKNS